MQPGDLVRLAELIRLSARTVQLFPDTASGGNGQPARVAELGQRLEAVADELLELAREIEAAAAKGH